MENTNELISRCSSEEELSESRATDSSISEQTDYDSSDSSSSTSTLVSEEQLDSSAVDSIISAEALSDSGYLDSSIGTSDPSEPSSSGSIGTLPDVGSLALDDLLSPGTEHPEEEIASANHPLDRTLTKKKSASERTQSREERVMECTISSPEKKQVPKSVGSDSLNEDLPSVNQYEPIEEQNSGESGQDFTEESGERSSENDPSVSDHEKLEESESDASETVRK